MSESKLPARPCETCGVDLAGTEVEYHSSRMHGRHPTHGELILEVRELNRKLGHLARSPEELPQNQVGENFIGREWASYRAAVLVGVTNEIQIGETRRGFYAGARSIWLALNAVGRDEVSDDGIAVFEGLQAELLAFVVAVEAGRA